MHIYTKDHPPSCQGQARCCQDGVKKTNKQTRKEKKTKKNKGGCGYANHAPAYILKLTQCALIRGSLKGQQTNKLTNS